MTLGRRRSAERFSDGLDDLEKLFPTEKSREAT